MSTQRRQFTAFSRLLHWTMAAMILTMLCIDQDQNRDAQRASILK